MEREVPNNSHRSLKMNTDDVCGIDLNVPHWIITVPDKRRLELASVLVTKDKNQEIVPLRSALIIIGKADAFRTFELHGNKPIAQLVSSWAKVARRINKHLTIAEEFASQHEYSVTAQKLYTIHPNGIAVFFIPNEMSRSLRLHRP